MQASNSKFMCDQSKWKLIDSLNQGIEMTFSMPGLLKFLVSHLGEPLECFELNFDLKSGGYNVTDYFGNVVATRIDTGEEF